LLLFSVTITVHRSATAHLDFPDPQPLELDDRITLDGLTLRTDQDDGAESEYCLKVEYRHDRHEHADVTRFGCDDINWDDPDPTTGEPYDEPTNRGAEGNLPLVGPNGKSKHLDWDSHRHLELRRQKSEAECAPTEQWTLTITLTESDASALSDVVDTVAVAASLTGEPHLEAAGKAAKVLSTAIDLLKADIQDLGSDTFTWPRGDSPVGPDPGTVGGTSRSGLIGFGQDANGVKHFSYVATKRTKAISTNCAVAPVATPSSTPSPSPAPSPSPVQPFPTPTPTPTPTPSPEPPPPQGCYDNSHLLRPYLPEAAQRWDRLHVAASQVDFVSVEPGASSFDVTPVRRDLRNLVGTVGRYAAELEILEAEATSGVVSPDDLARARADLVEGDAFFSSALNSGNTNDMHSALESYERAFNSLVPQLHDCAASTGVGGRVGVLGAAEPSAEAANDSAVERVAPILFAAASLSVALGVCAWYALKRRLG